MLNLSNFESLLITGANGFVGRSVFEKILSLETPKLPKKIILLTHNGIDFEIPDKLSSITTVQKHDLTKPWFFDFECTHIINLAADGSRSPYSEEANTTFKSIGKNLSEWLKSTNNKPQVFHASSGACFGYKSPSLEKSEDIPKAGFIDSRLEVENLLISASDSNRFNLSIGRLFTFSGNLLLKKNQYAITDFVRSALETGKIKVTGNPETVRSYMHQEAMAAWILQSLINPDGSIDLQIGASEPVTVRELAEFVARQTNADLDFAQNFGDGDIYVPDNNMTKTKLGLSEGLHWTLAVQEMITAVRMEKDGTR